MKRVGILAYGSLLDDPRKEIEAVIVNRIKNVVTPFKIEFARSSKTRDYAPTLIPVETGGAENKAQILLLKEGITEEKATDMLWRRETNQVGSDKKYKRPTNPGKDSVLVERLEAFNDVDVVLYTKIGANIDPLTPQELSRLAIRSALSKSGAERRDGISYLINAKSNGIQTPLMALYEKEIFRELKVESLENALHILDIERLKREKRMSEGKFYFINFLHQI